MLRILPLFLFLVTIVGSAQNPLRLGLRPWAEGIGQVIHVTHCGDDRLFAVSQWGAIFIITDSMEVSATPFLDISGQVLSGGERGLLGLAFDPDHATNGHFYVHYMAPTGPYGVCTLSRFTVSAEDPDVADPDSELVLYAYDQPSTIHQGGHIEFGSDGMLYLALGDGGPGGDPNNEAQDLTSPMGKILRIDPLEEGGYAIPDDNPYFTATGDTLREIYASGLRNPYRFCFDPVTDDLWLADVGESSYEEVNFWPGGSVGVPNFGWRCYEGLVPFNTTNCGDAAAYVAPVHTAAHALIGGTACAFIGGRVYRGTDYPHMYGRYFFVDLCNEQFDWLLPVQGEEQPYGTGLVVENPGFTGMGQGADGTLYAAHLYEGRVYKIVDRCPMDAPTITQVDGSLHASDAPIHQWLLAGDTIPGATAATYDPTENGWYGLVVDHGDGCVLYADSVYYGSTEVHEATLDGLRIHPQPANGPIELLWSGRPPGVPLELYISTTNGEVVMRQQWPADVIRSRIDLTTLANGLYHVVVQDPSNGAMITSPLIVQQ